MTRTDQTPAADTLGTGATALRARGFGWRPAGRRAPVLDDITLRIDPGERVLLLGASGSGKSTLLQAWAGVLGDDDDGEQLGELSVDGRHPADARGRVGLLLQDPEAGLVLERVRDDTAFGPENLGVPRERIADRVDDALDDAGLTLPPGHRTADLSGGQKQRVALAGVLALRPGALLLDEPTAQLDPVGVREVAAAVAETVRRESLTLVVIEHRVDVWAPLVDRVIVLDAGRVIADGPLDTVLAEQGALLAERGVWVPAHPPVHPPAGTTPPGPVLLRAAGLGIQPAGGPLVAEGIDLEVHAGEIVALTGANGSGKSTLALTLAGLLPPAQGTVTAADGTSPHEWSSRELSERVGVVFQNPEHQFVAATVREELGLGTGTVSDELLDRLRLRRKGSTSPFRLSGGEKRRLSVATALASAPPLLLLDEPTFGQDRGTWAELAALIAAHRDAGGAAIIATHDIELITALNARELRLPTPPQPGDTPGGAQPSVGVAVPPPEVTSVAELAPRIPLIDRLNPVAALAAGLAPALILIATIDVVSAATALLLQLLLLPLLGVDARTLIRRTAPVWIAAPLTGLTILLYGQTSGTVYAEFLFVRISDGSIELALASMLRVLAIGIPAVALFARVDVTRLGDALAQTLRLPARFVLGAVAALRMITVLRDDLRMLERARRARGLAERGRVRRLGGLALSLLVLAIRRGAALAIAMEARGFGAPVTRTWMRPSLWTRLDTATVLVALSVAVLATIAAVATGQWNSILAGRDFG